MEKVKTSEEAASRLRAKEEEINRRFEALQDEVKQTKEEVFDFVNANPWLGICGTTLVGILVGVLIGGKSQKAKQKEIVDGYVRGLSEMTRNSGVNEEQVGVLLREALRDSAPQYAYPVPKKKSAGVTGKLFGMVADVALGYLSKTLMSTLEAQLSSKESASGPDASEG